MTRRLDALRFAYWNCRYWTFGCDDLDWPGVDIVKLDIEGAETQERAWN
jgi:hypothetical protein